MDELQLRTLRSAIAGLTANDEQEPWECPACRETAALEGELEVNVDVDWDYADGESYPVGHEFLVLAIDRLTCLFCHLRLAGREELRAAEVPVTVHVQREDAADIIAEMRYDPDDLYD